MTASLLPEDTLERIGIIGGGFTGTLTAVHLIQQGLAGLEIILISRPGTFSTGTAYAPYSGKHLLNVAAGRMSAFRDRPDHFLQWLMARPEFQDQGRELVASAFVPRRLYGEYLTDIWTEALATARSRGVRVTRLEGTVTDLEVAEGIRLTLEGGQHVHVDRCVIATGNPLPRDPRIANTAFYPDPHYHRDPWSAAAVSGVRNDLPVLIVGNGLTMVDTVFGLLEHDFKGTIISLSPNGFNILPHRHSGLAYTKLAEEITDDMDLVDLVRLVNRHVKTVKQHGLSAEPVIDSIRPFTQRIWKRLSEAERRTFMARLRHLWGVARHRIPLHVHDRIQQLRIEDRLLVRSGRIVDFTSAGDHVIVDHIDRRTKRAERIRVSRIINCTGPETDLMHLEGSFLKKCLTDGLLAQDALKLGIRTDTDTYQVLWPDGRPHERLFTIGPTLRGELWESTAVNELRDQAERLAKQLSAERPLRRPTRGDVHVA